MRAQQPTSRDRLLEAGRSLFWQRGFHDVGLNEILVNAGVPKGSFYHHFTSKEGFAIQVVDAFAADILASLDRFLGADEPPLDRLRHFFESQRVFYAENGCREGCLLGNFGQELADTSESLRQHLEQHQSILAERFASCFEEALIRGDLPPGTDCALRGRALLAGWHGAMLLMKVHKDLEPVDTFLRFHLSESSALAH